MKKLILTSFFLLLTSFIFCQKGSISGVITDDKKEGLPGVTISIEKTTKATSADIDGSYKLGDIEPGKHIVVFSMIGYSTQKKEINVTAGQDIKINITLKEDVLNLEEVVVVGYGRRQKRDVTGSIETIKSGELEQIVVPSFDQALQGLASGVQVTAANGVAGAPVKINVRGNSSISAGSEPLYVIDGIPMTTGDFSPGNLGSLTNALSDINPNDIESIEVLKDAAAAAIYGSRGSNGVILITTKKGKAGKTKFNAGFYTGIVNSSNRLELLNASEHLALRDKAQKAIAVFYNDTSFKPEAKNKAIYGKWTRGQADSLAALGGTDWIDKVLRTGLVQEGNISAQGGNDKTVFYIGGSYYKEKGFLVGNNFDRINGRVNLENNAANSLKIGTDIGLAYTKNVRVPIGDAGGLGDAQRLFPYIPVYNRDGSYFYPTIPNYPGNAVWEIDNQHFTAKSFRAVPKIYADLDLSKLLFSETDNSQQSTNSELKFRSEFGMDVLQQVEEEFDFRNVEDPTSTSTAWDRATNVINYTINNYFTYNLKLKEIHNFNFTLGNSLEKSKTKGFGLNGYDFSNDFYTSPGNATSSNQSGYAYNTGYAFLSYFFRVNYKFRDRYLAGLSIRDDGSSRFGSENRYGWFPAFSAGWIVTEENFMQDIKKLSFLKLRASYGFTGNANIGDFAYLGLYSTTNGYVGESGVVPGSLPNPKLGWEKAAQLDITLDYGLFNNRVSGTFTYYNKKTSDMLLYISIPTSSGFSSILQNVGKMSNHGFEITLSTKNIDRKHFKWNTEFNIAFNRNKVLDVSGLPPDAFESGQPGEGRVMEGYPVGQAYVVRFAGISQSEQKIPVYDANGNKTSELWTIHAGQELFYDKNGHLMSGDATNTSFYDNRVPCGKPNPDFVGGISNTFSYKGFDLFLLFAFVYGNTIYDDPAKNQIGAWDKIAQRTEINDAWTPENHSNEVPSLALYGTKQYPIRNSDRFLFDGSFLRLRSVSFGYSLPETVCRKLFIESCRIYILGSNLLTFTKYPGWDPEVLRNVNPNSQQGNISFAGPSLQTPQTRTFSIGASINF